jgi:hypothetical protein
MLQYMAAPTQFEAHVAAVEAAAASTKGIHMPTTNWSRVAEWALVAMIVVGAIVAWRAKRSICLAREGYDRAEGQDDAGCGAFRSQHSM